MSLTTKNQILLRIFFDIILLICLFIAPWWLLLVLSLALVFYFNFFIEAILFSLFYDLLYSTGTFLVMDLFFYFVLVSFVIIEILKRKIIFY